MGPPSVGKTHRGAPRFTKKRKSRWPDEGKEIKELETRIRQEMPARGWQPDPVNKEKNHKEFSELALSQRTLAGLRSGGFRAMRPIQAATIPHALAGRDILGAARTGSGKTVAFLVPVLELLYRNRWTGDVGALGGLILSPTRELTLQIFEVLKVIGVHHDISAGAIVGGGTDINFEKQRIGNLVLLVATFGRMLQHLEETPILDPSGALCLVVDEADRAVDMGFFQQLESIVHYLPKSRQTLLFSATLAGSSSVLESSAKLKLSPRLTRLRTLVRSDQVEFLVAATDHQQLSSTSKHSDKGQIVHDTKASSEIEEDITTKRTPTPRKLRQCYVVCALDEKIDMIFAFIKAHLRSKCLVFLSSCAQVRFFFQALRGLQPGIPLLALHGKQHQKKRTAIYYDFCQKQHAILFATDVAARGLDFPKIDWVVQLDAPEDADAYVHRAGRAARGEADGDAMLCLLPSEEKRFIELLQAAHLPVTKLGVNPTKLSSFQAGPHVKALVARRPELKELAQKAFRSYVRSVVFAKDKEAFRVHELPLAQYALSLGLAAPPTVKLPADADKAEEDRVASHSRKNKNRKLQKLKEAIKLKKKAAKDPTVLTGDDDLDDNGLDEILIEKDRKQSRVIDDDDDADLVTTGLEIHKKDTKRLKIRGGIDVATRSKKIVFDDQGKPMQPLLPTIDEPAPLDPVALRANNDDFVQRMRARLQESAAEDRARERASRRERKEAKKESKRKSAVSDDDADSNEGSSSNKKRRKSAPVLLLGSDREDHAGTI